MFSIGVDYHPSFQQIAFLDQETGECGERRLNHSDGEAEKFYRDLKQRGVSVRVGMEATGYSRWFERLLAELGIELWIGDAAEIKRLRVRRIMTYGNCSGTGIGWCKCGHGSPIQTTGTGISAKPIALFLRRAQTRSKRSRFITLVHAATKSFTNFSLESAHA